MKKIIHSTLIKRILVPVALNMDLEIPLRKALYLREAYGSEIILLHIVPEFSYFHRILSQSKLGKLKNKAQKKLRKLVERILDGSIPEFISLKIVSGALIPAIVKAAEETKSDLIIIKKHEKLRGRYRFFKKENSEKLLADSNCHVITLSEEPDDYEIKKILIPIDMVIKSDKKVAWASSLAKNLHADIHVVFVQNMELHPENSYSLKKARAIENELQSEGFNANVVVLKTKNNAPHEAILEYAAKIRPDLILVMAQKESLLPGNSGENMAREILHKSEFPVFNVTPGNHTILDHIFSPRKTIGINSDI
jgi:nucleotide-binding universal stress UspA family protein